MARALYCSVDPDAYPPARRAEEVGPRLSRHLQRRPPADAGKLLIEPARRLPHLQVLRRRAAISGRHRLADERRADRASAAGRAPRLLRRFPLHAERHPRRHDRRRLVAIVRLFEAAACATPVISDRWDGIDSLFEPGPRDHARRQQRARSSSCSRRATTPARSATPRARGSLPPHGRAPRAPNWSTHIEEAAASQG